MPATSPTNNVSQPPAMDTDPQTLLNEQKAEDLKNEVMTMESNLEKSRHDLADNIARNIGS